MTSSADYPTSSLPIIISPDEPSCQSDCQLWFDCTANEWKRCDGLGTWVPLAGSGGTGLHADLTDLATSGHPGTVITIPAGVQGNAVAIAADGSLMDAGVPPGGVGGTTNLSHVLRTDEIEIESSSGQNTIIAAATNAQIGWATAAQITQLEGTDAAGTARPPTAHAASHGTGQADELTPADIGADAAGTPRPPTVHAASHGQGQADEVTPAAIGAATAAQGALADTAMQPNDPLVDLSSGVATDGQVPKADGAGAITWEDESGGGGSNLHADLTDTATDGHPGGAINIPGGVQGNAVSIAADGTLQDSGVPPGGAGGTTDLSHILRTDEIEIESSSGQNTIIGAATNAQIGWATAAQIVQLEGTDAAGTPRPPVAHASTHATGQADEIVPADIGADAAGTPRPPIAHAASHGTGQADEIVPADIGAATAAQGALADSAMQAVIDDTDPYVGGDLKIGGTNNYAAVFTDLLSTERGSAGYTDAPKAGVYLAYAPAGVYNEADGGILAIPGALEAHGTAFQVESIAHSSTVQEVRCTPEGILFGVDPPPPGWSDSAVDTGSYDLGTGTGVGAWVELTGVVATVQSDVGAGERLEIQAYVTAVNKTTNRAGTIEIGFGLDGATPTVSGDTHSIVGGFSGSLPAAVWSWSTHGGLTAGQTISVWGRRTFGDHSQFGVDLVGTTDNHVLEIFVHGSGGGGGSPTNITISHAPTTVTVESSTGTNGTIAQAIAGGNAGVMSGADKTKVDAAWIDGSTVIDWGLGAQNLGSITGNTQVDLDNGHDFTGTMDGLGDWDVDFISTAGHGATHWSFTMDVAGRIPVWKFNGAVIDLTEGYDISTGASRYEFFFRRNVLGTSVSVIGVQ